MYTHSVQGLQAEISYRQERIKRDFQRPLWFQQKAAKPVTPTRRPQAVRAQHAM